MKNLILNVMDYLLAYSLKMARGGNIGALAYEIDEFSYQASIYFDRAPFQRLEPASRLVYSSSNVDRLKSEYEYVLD